MTHAAKSQTIAMLLMDCTAEIAGKVRDRPTRAVRSHGAACSTNGALLTPMIRDRSRFKVASPSHSVEKSGMERRTIITGIAATLALAAGRASRSIAGEIQVGGTFEVKANSIWFEDVSELERWQRLRKHGDAKALRSYQDKVLSRRDAWQFVNPLTVKIISYDRGKDRVKVEMTTPGRFLGSTWFLDIAALQD
jgi:hypothetical protein